MDTDANEHTYSSDDDAICEEPSEKAKLRRNPLKTMCQFWRRLSKKGRRIIAVLLIAALLAGIGLHFLGGRTGGRTADTAYTTAEVTHRDISSAITGSGTLEAANSYSVTSLVEGSILTDSFEEGDEVEEGAVLYTLDSSDTSTSLEQAEISVDQAQRNYDDQLENRENLTVQSPIAGQVYSIDVEVGDTVSAGQTVATVRDASVMSLAVHFPADDAENFYVGQSATVTLDGTFETLTGTISEINGSNTVLTGNVIVRSVTIDVTNPGALSTTQSASAAVGSVTSSDSGTFAYRAEKTVTASVSGEVSRIAVSEGSTVSENQTLMVLTSDEVEDSIQSASDSLRNAELSLENQYDQLDNYTITAPISGTVVDVIDAQESESTYYGMVLSSEKSASSSSTTSSSTSSVQIVTEVVCTDGFVRTFYHTGSVQSEGRLVSVSITQSGTTIKGLSTAKLEGTVNSSATKFAGYDFAEDVEILDTDSNGGYAKIYPSRLAGAKLSGSDVAFYTLNDNDEIDRLILEDVTGDTAEYVYITNIEDNSMDMNLSAVYSYYQDGQITNYNSDAIFSISTGGAALYYDEDGSIRSMRQLSSVTLTELGSLSAMAGSQEYTLDENVQVILRSSGSSGYYETTLSSINAEDYTLKGWYDNLGYSAGGRIRIIVATEK